MAGVVIDPAQLVSDPAKDTEANMDESTASTVRALRFVAIFALLVSCGILVAIVFDKTDVPEFIPLSLLTTGLALNVVAAAKTKKNKL